LRDLGRGKSVTVIRIETVAMEIVHIIHVGL
jgi:hypothetical protein